MEVNRNVFEKCGSLINQCLHDEKIEVDKLNDIILAGGSSYIPKKQKCLWIYIKNSLANNPTRGCNTRGSIVRCSDFWHRKSGPVKDSDSSNEHWNSSR